MSSPSPPNSSSLQVEQSEPRRTSIAFAEPTEGRRQASITQNNGTASSTTLPGTYSRPRSDRHRSFSSPPPPPSFLKRVGFDTFDNKDASDFSLTLKAKHKDYQYTRRSRTFLCGTDQNDYSEFALEWLIDELVDDGDEIVCLRVVDKDSKISSDSSLQERLYREEARKLLNDIIDKNTEDKAISIILEFAVGKVHETIQRMIHIYEPVILIVGTRGRPLGGLQGLLPGSVSKYCLQHSPVPVIVVRPSTKREKKKKKRQDNPNRRSYIDILERSSTSPSIATILNHPNNSTSKDVSENVSNASISSIGDENLGGASSSATTEPADGVHMNGIHSEDISPNSSPVLGAKDSATGVVTVQDINANTT